jgi:hypothetical protein
MRNRYEKPIQIHEDPSEIYPSTCVYGCGCWIVMFLVYSIVLWVL